MDNNESPTAALSLSKQLPLALGLGWSAGELVGRYRHGIHPRNPAAGKAGQGWALPRLSYSSRALRSNNDLFWLLAQRLIVLSDELGLDDLEDKEKEGSVDARIRALPAEIRKYIWGPLIGRGWPFDLGRGLVLPSAGGHLWLAAEPVHPLLRAEANPGRLAREVEKTLRVKGFQNP